jgi:magnesium transporter
MLSATLTGIIITKYENAFAAVPILVAFIPMLMDTGGNCGSQSSTLIIRGLALEDIKFKDIFKVIFKEIRISFIVGVVLALVNSVRIYIMYQHESVPALLLAFVVGVTLVCVVMLAKLIGSVLPMLADRIGLDPALMASPLITTIVDTCSVLIFFNIAMNVLSNYVTG